MRIKQNVQFIFLSQSFCLLFLKYGRISLLLIDYIVHLHGLIKLKHAQNARDSSMHYTFDIHPDWNHNLFIRPRLWHLTTSSCSEGRESTVSQLTFLMRSHKKITGNLII